MKDGSYEKEKVNRCWGWVLPKLQRWGVSWPWQWGWRAVGLSQGLWQYDDHMVVPAALRGWNGTWGGVFAELAQQPRIARALEARKARGMRFHIFAVSGSLLHVVPEAMP